VSSEEEAMTGREEDKYEEETKRVGGKGWH
jgi:hypothetical protein